MRALRGDTELFHQLSEARVYITESITTELELGFKNGPVRVQSDRLAVHHEIIDGQLKIYVPKDEHQREPCYRSQLPKLLSSIMIVALEATQAVFMVLSQKLASIDDILLEQDIPMVDWIPKPVYPVSVPPAVQLTAPLENLNTAGEQQSSSLRSLEVPVQTTVTLQDAGYTSELSLAAPNNGPTRPPFYERLIEEVVQSAHRAGQQQQRPSHHQHPQTPSPHANLSIFEYDHEETFGNRDADTLAHDMRIGASGESYVRNVPKVVVCDLIRLLGI